MQGVTQKHETLIGGEFQSWDWKAQAEKWTVLPVTESERAPNPPPARPPGRKATRRLPMTQAQKEPRMTRAFSKSPG